MSELESWIRLTGTEGIGSEAVRKLLAAFGLPDQIFSASLDNLRRVVTERQAAALTAAPSEAMLALIERTQQWCSEPDNYFITFADQHYPAQLLEIPDPPPVLYAKGRIELLARASIAVVGSRNATSQGLSNAKQFSSCLSEAELTITSGMALGIDTAAHTGGLQGAGSTIAVIGTGIDIVYPARNRNLAHQIAKSGCIVSEYPLGTPPKASNFPRRNRLISGLSRGVLVIEAAVQSGSLITARMAAEQGRDVFAIPGSIHSPLAKGCHYLIKQGAKLVETADDILLELRIDRITQQNLVKTTTEAPTASAILTQMGYDPIHPDVLAQRCNIDSGELSVQLLALELEGQVEMIAGGLYQRLIS